MPVILENATVFMCSGQGSQKPGMGTSLLMNGNYPEVDNVFQCASDVLGRDIAALVRDESDGAAERLNETRNAQAAIAALSIGIGRELAAWGIAPGALLGFSLGQISALALGGMVSTEDAFRIIDARSAAMDEAARENPGAMSALLKADGPAVEELCAQCADVMAGEILAPANYNSPGQIVIAGSVEAVARAEEAWAAKGGRATRLATQGAFHSPLMASAREPFAAALEAIDFAEPKVPIICNTDATALTSENVRERLVAHLVSPVKFQQSAETLAGAGANNFVEVGFGGVLSGLVRRIAPDAKRACVQDATSLEEML